MNRLPAKESSKELNKKGTWSSVPILTSVANMWLKKFVTTTHQSCLYHSLNCFCMEQYPTHSTLYTKHLNQWAHTKHRTRNSVVLYGSLHTQIVKIQCISPFYVVNKKSKVAKHKTKNKCYYGLSIILGDPKHDCAGNHQMKSTKMHLSIFDYLSNYS